MKRPDWSAMSRAVNAACTCGGMGPNDDGVCPACLVWHRMQSWERDGLDHRTDPRAMEDRWKAMGYEVEWIDEEEGYIVWPVGQRKPYTFFLPAKGSTHGPTALLRTVDEVESFVVSHASDRATERGDQ